MRYTSETTFDEMVADIEGKLLLGHFTSKQQSKDAMEKVNRAFEKIAERKINDDWDYTNVNITKKEPYTHTLFDNNGDQFKVEGVKVYINKIYAFAVRNDGKEFKMFRQSYIHEVKEKHFPLYKFFGNNVNHIKILMELRDKIKSFEIIKPIKVESFENKLSNYLHKIYKDRAIPEKLTVTDIFKTKDGEEIPLFKENINVFPHSCQNTHGTRWWRYNWYINGKLTSMSHVQKLMISAELEFKNGEQI